jgi:hypothetical protein
LYDTRFTGLGRPLGLEPAGVQRRSKRGVAACFAVKVHDHWGDTSSLTGTAPPAGQLVADGTILFLDDLGVPVTTFETSGIVSMRGNYAATTAAICAALT